MTTTLQTVNASASPETQINENFDALSALALFSRRHPATTGLTWAFYGGRYNGSTIADGTVTLTASSTNYVVAELASGTVSVSTATTNWDNTASYARLYKITTGTTSPSAIEDHRIGNTGLFRTAAAAAASGLTITSQSAAYTLVLGDANTGILHPSADTTARAWTIPANASVAYPVGTAITFINQASAGVLTISITTDTMRLAGAGTTGSRTLAANGIATAIKLTSTEWLITGTGLT